jgi:hypothetical protein
MILTPGVGELISTVSIFFVGLQLRERPFSSVLNSLLLLLSELLKLVIFIDYFLGISDNSASSLYVPGSLLDTLLSGIESLDV